MHNSKYQSDFVLLMLLCFFASKSRFYAMLSPPLILALSFPKKWNIIPTTDNKREKLLYNKRK